MREDTVEQGTTTQTMNQKPIPVDVVEKALVVQSRRDLQNDLTSRVKYMS